MELIVGKYAGMCEGVNYAVKKAKEIVKENTELKILPGYLVTDSYGMIVRKGNTELLNSINECLEELKSSGKIEEYIINHTK